MRILNIPDTHAPASEGAPASLDVKRVEVLETITKSILQKLQGIEERIEVLESSPILPVPAESPKALAVEPLPMKPPAPMPMKLDEEAVKKGLDKMWKYLNDQAV